ncbi:E3 ubiquitin-protein ligase Siah1-like [Harmonia axyridis]|uniref:E3 ubiquitin-protein ligase Siah1-like n=1 Tax=Harmonia axyridis TaxID=115357 RepID=UPI001E27875D|nr:E3 ubiquitin-protein ligase Siah1-like [Harmonia axyridis]
MASGNVFTQLRPCHAQMNEYVKKLITCPYCQVYVTPPYRQCSEGHLLCSNPECRKSDTICFCGRPIIDFEIKRMKLIYDMLCFSCEYEKNGCKAVIRGKDLESHLLNCEYKNRTEPLSPRRSSV